MWTWISCYLIGHDYGVCCQAGAMFLRCQTCGRRSNGWDLQREPAHAMHDHGDRTHHSPVLASVRHH